MKSDDAEDERHQYAESDFSRIDFGLAGGREDGIFCIVKTTIDHAGRLVIPKDIRRESEIKPGMPLDVR